MTEVIRLALYTEVLGPWDGDCAGGRFLSTDTGLANLLPLGVLNTSALLTISSHGSISICLSSIVTNKHKAKYVSFYLLLANWVYSQGRQRQDSAVICSGILLFSSRVLRPSLVTAEHQSLLPSSCSGS